jgi:cobalt-zinc-cadmium efflux system membrane fusion protein
LWLIGGIVTAVALAMLVMRPNSGGEAIQRVPESDQTPNAGADGGEPSSLRIPDAAGLAMGGFKFATIEARPLKSELVCNGRVGFNENRYAQVRPRVDGILTKVLVDVGTLVHAGQELAVIDSATLGEYKSLFVYAVLNVKYTETYCERLRKLADQQAIPSKTLFEMEHMLQEQQLDVAKARQKLVNLGFSDQQIDDFVAENDTHAKLSIGAPWAGVLVQRHAVEGESVAANSPVFAVADLTLMWVHLSAYESDLSKIRLDQPLVFAPDGFPGREFVGKVTWISPEVDPQTRTIEIRGQVANSGDVLRANMFGKGRLTVHSSENRPVAPVSAVQQYQGHNIVFVHKPSGEYLPRTVEIGIKEPDYWEVLSGLVVGEEVVTTGSFQLKSNLENPAFGKVE